MVVSAYVPGTLAEHVLYETVRANYCRVGTRPLFFVRCVTGISKRLKIFMILDPVQLDPARSAFRMAPVAVWNLARTRAGGERSFLRSPNCPPSFAGLTTVSSIDLLGLLGIRASAPF